MRSVAVFLVVVLLVPLLIIGARSLWGRSSRSPDRDW
jgi:hypothetical protein